MKDFPVYKISVCMATYNGEKYLKQQIDSILAQSNKEWELLIRDDGSHDNTVSIIKDYQTKYPNKIKLITDNKHHLGANLNFRQLLEYINAEYIMFSDQDDVWLPNKIELTLRAMKSAEQLYPEKPVLVHTDLKVVDPNLNIIAESMWSYQKLFPEIGDNLSTIMARNVVTGCAMMLNSKAKAVSIPIPKEAVMYDWWIAISVAKHGKIIPVAVSSILYRQHSENLIGVHQMSISHLLKKLCSLKQLISANYRMIKKADPHVSFASLLLNKFLLKFHRPN